MASPAGRGDGEASLVYLGVIKRTRGNKGELAVAAAPAFYRYPEESFSAQLKSARFSREARIEYLTEKGGVDVIKIQGVDTIGAAFAWIGYKIYAPIPQDSDLETWGPDEHSLEGYQVVELDGTVWGVVSDVTNLEVQPLIVVARPDSTKEILIPWVAPIVQRIDHQHRTVHIDPPPGLREL